MHLRNDYINGLSVLKLNAKYGCSKHIIYRLISDISRSLSESMKMAHSLYPDKFKLKQESKEKIRNFRLKWMKENPEKTAWRQSNLSYPEKLFLDKINHLKWNEKYLIIRERSFFPYYIDFAFENQKFAIEIDGKQHENPDRKLSDSKKDELLNSHGWTVLRFTASKINQDMDNCIQIIDSYLKDTSTEVGVYSHGEYKQMKKPVDKTEFGITVNCRNSQLAQRKVIRPPYKQLLLEVNENGYTPTGRKYGDSNNTIKKWIKMYEKYGENF